MPLGRLIVLLVGAGVVLGGGFLAFRPQPVLVDLATVEIGDLEITVDDEGETRIRDVYTVSAPVAGRVLRAPREVGDTVSAERTVVAVMMPQAPTPLDDRARAELTANLRAAEAALVLAKAELGRAQAERAFWQNQLTRDRRLLDRGALSAQALDQTELELSIREAAVATAEATIALRTEEVAKAQALLIEPGQGIDPLPARCCLEVRAPAEGRVLQRLVESEQVVEAGTPLLTLGDPADLEIVVDLLSSDAVRVREGDVARLEQWGGDGVLEAVVRRIEPAGFTEVSALGIDEQRVRVILDLTSPHSTWAQLGHGFRVLARIVVLRREEVVVVPTGALFRDGTGWAVFVVEAGRAGTRPIELGARGPARAEVLDGLAVGEVVVLYPSDRLADGVRVVQR